MRAGRVVVSELAAADIAEQSDWYEAQSGKSLAERWEKAVTSAILRIVKSPNSGTPCAFKSSELNHIRRTSIASGARFTKSDELRDEKSVRTAHDCGLDEAKVHFFGGGIAVVYGREHAVGKDKSQPSAKVCQIWTDTWLKRDGKWQVIASQDNRVECK